MLKHYILIGSLALFVTGCADLHKKRTFHGLGNTQCTKIKREVNTSGSRMNQYHRRLLATDKARLIKEYQASGCEIPIRIEEI